MDVLIDEIDAHFDHYKNYITGDWKNELSNYKLFKQFNADIVDLLIHALVNSFSSSCYVVYVDDYSREIKVEAIEPTRSSVVAAKEIFLSKIGQHYDAIVEDETPVLPLKTNLFEGGGKTSSSSKQTTSCNSIPLNRDETTCDKAFSGTTEENMQLDSHVVAQSPVHYESSRQERNEEITPGHDDQPASGTLTDSTLKRRMKKIKNSQWDGLPVKKADALPFDIDGNCLYQLPYDKKDRLASSKDGRPWKKAITANTKEFVKGTRKIAKCRGSYECRSADCMFLTEYGKNNTANFDFASESAICRICKAHAIFHPCPALKVWEFYDNYVIIKHAGKHTCYAVPVISKDNKAIKENVAKRPDLPPKQIQREAILSELYGGKTIDEVKSTARSMIDTRKISSVKRKHGQSTHPFGHSIDALKRLKLESEKTDKYYIFDIRDAALSASVQTKTHVFKMSKTAAKIAIDMDKEGNHFMAKEYCFFDGNHKRCRGFITLGCYVYHPLLRRIIRLATMEVNVEDSDAIQDFWLLFNKVIADYKGDPSYTFNPSGWCADEAGSNWEGLFRVFGDVRDRIVSCVFHYRQSVNRFTAKLPTTKEQEKFKLLSIELQEAVTQTRYYETYEQLMRFITKKKHREQLLLNWFDWWHKRRANIFNAFKPVHGAPRTNWSEAFHASWSHSSSINLSLVDAAYHDIVDAILTELQLEEIGTGTLAPFRGPDEATRQARDFQDQTRRAAEYASTIQKVAKDLESASKSFTVDPLSTHRPDKWKCAKKRQRVSIHEVRARAEVIRLNSSSSEEENDQINTFEKRSKRRRPRRSKRFNDSLQKALEQSFKLLDYTKDELGIYCTVKGLEDTYSVTITNTPSCTCPYYVYKPNNVAQICKHLIWVYVKIIGLSVDDDVIQQVAFDRQELKRILEKAPSGLAIPPIHTATSTDRHVETTSKTSMQTQAAPCIAANPALPMCRRMQPTAQPPISFSGFPSQITASVTTPGMMQYGNPHFTYPQNTASIPSGAVFPSIFPFYQPPTTAQFRTAPVISDGQNNIIGTLTDIDINQIFSNDVRDRQPQVWYADKMIRNSTARCASCTRVQMLPGTLYVHVTGLWIPRGRRSAIQRTFFICAFPNCLSRKPPFSNLRVPPPEINVSVNSFLDRTDVDILRERNLPLLLPEEDQL